MDITTIKYPSHNDLVQWYYQLAQRIADSTGVTPEQVNELIDAYIAEHPYPVVPDDIITQSNAPANVVTSVNGKKGDVTVTGGGDVPDNVITEDNISANAVTSYNGLKGAVTGVARFNGKTGAVTGVASFNGKTGDVTGVASVNGKTGDVTVSEAPQNVITTSNIAQNAVTSFNGARGAVTGVASVNGVSGEDIELGGRESGTNAYVIRIAQGVALIVANINIKCVNQNPPEYAGVFPKCGYTNVSYVVGGTCRGDPTPFVPSSIDLETNEGVWTIVFKGIASGQQVTIGATVQACVTLLVWGYGVLADDVHSVHM